jgi:hypothetical protein
MSEVLFDIVFKGKFVNQIDKTKAVLHFSKIFKIPLEKAERFFDGKARTLKKSLNLDKASQFRATLKKAGLRVSMVKHAVESRIQKENELTMSKVGAIIVHKPFVQPKHFDTSQFSLDEVGTEIVHKEHIEKLEFDLAEIHMDEVGAVMIDKEQVPEFDIDITDISMQEVGAIFAEKPQIVEPEFDLSNLHIDEVGTEIVKKEKIPEPDIDIENIKMVD